LNGLPYRSRRAKPRYQGKIEAGPAIQDENLRKKRPVADFLGAGLGGFYTAGAADFAEISKFQGAAGWIGRPGRA